VDAVVVSAATTAFGIFTETPLRALAAEAADRALAESGFEPDEVGLVVFGNAAAGLLTGQEMIRAQVSLGGSRLAGRPMINIENACASGASAFHLACLAVSSGSYDVAVAVGAEKMTNDDRSLAARALATAVDVEAGPFESFMAIYAAAARGYMERTGATRRDVAAVAAKATRNGSLNPVAQVQVPLSVDDVLEARMIVDPLTRPMCSSIGDGAAAVVVCRAELAQRRALNGPRVLASVVGSGRAGGEDDLVERTAAAAYEHAGLGPADLDVVEVHDAAAPAELVIYEELGLASRGQGSRLIRDRVSELGGRCPVNPSGGLLARGHPIGATGLAQIVELTEQLRGRSGARQVDGARIALAENAGGEIGPGPAACAITILAAS
jgi:acetyl-CoA acetyltransferase